jgi:hypothetical protein
MGLDCYGWCELKPLIDRDADPQYHYCLANEEIGFDFVKELIAFHEEE